MNEFHVRIYRADRSPFSFSFEEASQRLQELPRLFFEPDGSFVWAAGDGEQVDGMLYDVDDRVLYLELRGNCSRRVWRSLLRAFGDDGADSAIVVTLPGMERTTLQTFENSSFRGDAR